jgi:cyclopropane-fatty-acyl-phospholipid synthase
MNDLFKKMMLKVFGQLQVGKLIIHDGNETHVFTRLDQVEEFTVTVRVLNPRFYRKMLLGGSVGAAESFMLGDWQIDDLTKALELVMLNAPMYKSIEEGLPSRIAYFFMNLGNRFRRNNISNAKKFIQTHYDLGNEFFACFLDETMMYSAAIFAHDTDTLAQASVNKLKVICDKLCLQSSDHLLEIGTGWGGLAIYAAREYGCRVTTTTISDLQYSFVRAEIDRLGLQDKITLIQKDYRELRGQYDKLVSVEMIEAVGHQYLEVFFRQCNHLLKQRGLMLLQAITINDGAYEVTKNSVDFIKKYIFPGGCLPSVGIIRDTLQKHTAMTINHTQDIGKHYVKTLRHWLTGFMQNTAGIKAMGFADNFIRLWEFYFCYCAAGFNQSYISNVQLLCEKV